MNETETKSKSPEEEKDKKNPESVGDGVPDVPKDETAETPSEAAPEATEETTPETAQDVSESAPEQSESAPEPVADTAAELEQLRAENLRLKTQLEAHGAGFRSENIEDAVLLAEHIAKRDGVEIAEALQAVAKKYPDWKRSADEKQRGGFKVGADAPKEKATDDSRLDEAFGLRKKK